MYNDWFPFSRSVFLLLSALFVVGLAGCPEDDAAQSSAEVDGEEPAAKRKQKSADGGADAAPEDRNDETSKAERSEAESDMDDEGDQKDEEPSAQPKSGADAPKQDADNTPAEPAEERDAAADGGTMSGLGGVLWTTQDFCAGDNQYGTSRVFLAENKAEIVEPKLSELFPSLSGLWYAYSQYNQESNRTKITVVDSSSLEVLYEKSLPDLLYGFNPHPKQKNLVLGLLSVDLMTAQNFVVVDVDKAEIIQRIEPLGIIDWTSDGRIMRMAADGRRWMSELGGEERELVKMEIPTGYSPGYGYWISPDNKQLVVQMQRYANDAWSDDLWIGSMDGGAMERLTKTTMTSYAAWSPDSRYIAFNVDPDIHAACGISFSPERWHQYARVYYLDASARNVSKVEEAHIFEALGNTTKRRLIHWTEN